ncbi:MAG: NADPH-dependent FMN reductase [Bacteriovorax sp.]
MKKILAISGSLRAQSSNTAILLAAIPLAPAGSVIELFSGLDLLPHFNPDRENEIIPSLVHFREKIKESHALLICSPEYAHGVPGTLKNALDWIVGTGELDHLPVGIIHATPLYEGKCHALESLIEILTTMSATITNDTVLSISKVRSKLDESNLLNDEETKNQVMGLLLNLLKRT